MLQHSQLRARPLVPLRDQQSVSNWLYNKENAIDESEIAFVDQRSDLFSMVPKSKSSLRRLLERSRHFRLARFWRIAPTRLGDSPGFDHGDTYYSSGEKIDRFVNIVILLLGVLHAHIAFVDTLVCVEDNRSSGGHHDLHRALSRIALVHNGSKAFRKPSSRCSVSALCSPLNQSSTTS